MLCTIKLFHRKYFIRIFFRGRQKMYRVACYCIIISVPGFLFFMGVFFVHSSSATLISIFWHLGRRLMTCFVTNNAEKIGSSGTQDFGVN